MNRALGFCFLLLITGISCNPDGGVIRTGNIVIVNIGKRFRSGIAQEIEIINAFHPKVVAIDAYFPDALEPGTDSILIAALNHCDNRIMMAIIRDFTVIKTDYAELNSSLPGFLTNSEIGFTNVIFEDDEFKTVKRFSTHEELNDSIIYHFGVRTAMEFDSLKAVNFVKSNPRVVDIKYLKGGGSFKTFSDFDVFNGKVKRPDIEGKIVLFGYLGPYDGYDGQYDEDKFFSPQNDKALPGKPDMYGVVILANIAAQVLE